MSLTEQTRLRLHKFLEEHMERDLANEVMEWLPHGELATKDDIEALRLATKADIEGLRAATKADIEHVGTTLGLQVELATEQVRSEFNKALRTHTLVLVGTIVTLNAMLASAARIF